MPAPDHAPPPRPEAPYDSPSSRRRLWTLLALAGVGAGAWWVLPRGDGSLARIRANGGLRAGYAVDAPLALVTPAGEVTGASPETARLVAEQLGIGRLDWVQTEFRDLLPGLLARRFDMIAGGLITSAERARHVRFSDPILRLPLRGRMGGNGAQGAAERAASAIASAPKEDVAFAFHPADAALQAAWNQAQAQVLGTPRHLALMASFGFTADDLPTPSALPEGASR